MLTVEKIRRATERAKQAHVIEDRWRTWTSTIKEDRCLQSTESEFFRESNLPEDIQEDIRLFEKFLGSEEAAAAAALLNTTKKEVYLGDRLGSCPILFNGKGLSEQNPWGHSVSACEASVTFRRRHNVPTVEYIRRFVEMVAETSLLPT